MMVNNLWLVVWNMAFIFPNQIGMMIQSDYFVFRGVENGARWGYHCHRCPFPIGWLIQNEGVEGLPL